MSQQTSRNKTALITGGSRGLGREIALRLGAQGTDVILTYRQERDRAQSVVDELQNSGRKAASVQVELNGTGQLDALCARVSGILEEWNAGLDILIPNAGVLTMKSFGELTEEDLDRQYQVNYKSLFFLLQRLIPRLSDGGRIVTIGSGTTHHAFLPLIGYAPLKAAVETLTVYLAQLLGSRGITVNAVAPGALDTDFNAPLFEAMPAVPGYIGQQTALSRIGMPTDVVGVVAFLCSDEARWITGHRLDVSGGFKL